VKNTPFDGQLWADLPEQVLLQRVQQVIREELSPCQRETLMDYYFHRMSIPEIAAKRGVQKSTAWRTLCRAERKLRRYLKY
jgi:DNA-directed RNA polymerase specialized sigma24 family protein